MEGYKTLRAKEAVQFEVVKGDNGPQAADVRRVVEAVEPPKKTKKKEE